MELFDCNLPPLKKICSGKVREVFDLASLGLDEQLLLVTTDRLSAFDCILPNTIPQKGFVLTQLSKFWFQKFSNLPHHLLETEVEYYPKALEPYKEQLRGRSMIVKKTKPLPLECIVRGYLAGSGWREYQEKGMLAGVPLPTGLLESERLERPHFTPSTKAKDGHDESITWQECQELVGEKVAEKVRSLSLELYQAGAHIAAQRGMIIADTKFEFGFLGEEIILIDECMTPDSSRFWSAASYRIGENPPSFDKQFVRDYLQSCGWNKLPPAPVLPEEIILKTAEKYQEALERFSKN